MAERRDPFSRLARDLRHILSAETRRHRVLRDRLGQLLLATTIVWALFTVAIYFIEHDAPGSSIHNGWEAAYWTASQMSTIGSGFANPVRPAAYALDMLLKIYAVIIVGALAGSLGAFFLHRRDDQPESAR
jgi:uncharacterized membrane protein